MLVAAAVLLASGAMAGGRDEEVRGKVLFLRTEQRGGSVTSTMVAVDVATREEQDVVRLPRLLRPGSWSPDFRRLALVAACVGGPGHGCQTTGPLYLYDVGTVRLRRVLRVSASVAAWSPTGRWIAVAGRLGDRSGIVLVDPRGRTRPRLIVRGGTPLDLYWSPDGSKILYGWVDRKTPHICCGLKYVVDLHTGRHRLVVNKGTAQGVDALWAPDGRQIAYSVYGSGWGKAGLWVANSDGTRPSQITPFPDELLAWSPDGLALALSRHPFNGEQGPTELILIGLGGMPTFATNVGSATWSPDSQWIVYSKTEPTGTHLYLAAADRRETKQLTFGPASIKDSLPQWVPSIPTTQRPATRSHERL